jgi:uncharacterized protein (TIGR03437 family)
MHLVRICLNVILLLLALTLGAYLFAVASSAQTRSERELKPDVRSARRQRITRGAALRPDGHTPQRNRSALLPARTKATPAEANTAANSTARRPARVVKRETAPAISQPGNQTGTSAPAATTPIQAGTSLSRVLHTSQLSLTSSAGSDEQYVDRNFDLTADERTTFDADGGSFDIAVGRSGARYEVFSATIGNRRLGALVVALDTNGNYVSDSSATYDHGLDFNLPSAIAVVSGTSNAGREFVIVSSSGFYGGTGNPDNEPTAGVVLLVRDPSTGGFDASRSRSLVAVGNSQLNNANALALLPNNNLLIADFDSNELRIVRDTNADGIPDTLDPVPYYTYPLYGNDHVPLDAPLDIAANSRGVVFSHSIGNDDVLLAIYDDNNDGYADAQEICVEGLSLDNNLAFHGLTVDREGTVYVIEDASGTADLTADGGNLGTPRIDAFPDPALNGFLLDGSIFATVDLPNSQALSGLSFGFDQTLGAVGHLTMTNSASRTGNATLGGLATILGTNLTRGAQGASPSDAATSGIQVFIEGRAASALSFNNSEVHVHVPDAVGTGVRSVVVYVNGEAVAADAASVTSANPGLFTVPQTGAGEVIALLASGIRYTKSPFPSQFDGQPSVIVVYGTGWRNSLPVTVRINGQPATVELAGPSGDFPGLDQINVRLPAGVHATAPIIVTTASGATSRTDAVVTIQ